MKEEKDLVVNENKLAVNEETGLVFHGNANEGMEDLDRTVLTIPRLKLLQATSPEVQGDEYRDLNLRAGDIVDTISKDKIEGNIIPVKVMKNTNVLFVPRNAEGKAALKARKAEIADEDLVQQGAIICSAMDGEYGDRFGKCSACGLCNFRGQEKPICSRAINVLAMLDNGTPIVISFRDTSYTYGKTFIGLLNNKSASGTPIQALKFKPTAVKKTAGDKQWYVLSMSPAGYATQEQYDRAYQMFTEYNKAQENYRVQEETFDTAAEASSAIDKAISDII